VIFGLSNGNTDENYTDIDFAIYTYKDDGNLYVFENGVTRGSFGSYDVGDVLRVAVEGGVVKYRKNGTLLYTSAVSPTYPLLVDTSLYDVGAYISGAVLGGLWAPTPTSHASTHNAGGDDAINALPFVAVDGTLATGANADVVASKLVYNKTCSDSDGDDVIDLHDGTVIGQIVTIYLGTKSGSDNAVITPVTKLGYSTITLDAANELATLQWQGATVGWAILYTSGGVA